MSCAISCHLRLVHPAAGDRGGPDPDPAGDHRRVRVVGDRVAVDGDLHLAERQVGLLAGDAQRAHVDEHQVVVGPAGDDRGARLDQRRGEGLRVRHRLRRVALELGAHRLLEGDRLGGDDVLERPALQRGEDGLVDRLGEVRVAEDHPAARAAQRLVGGGAHDVRVRHRARVHPGRHEAREVGHVGHQVGADLVGDRPEGGEVPEARVGGGAGDDHLRPMLARQARTSSMSIRCVSRSTWYGTKL